METLKLYWLGAPQVELKGQVMKLETRKAAALLCYLSLSPGECQRELLATMFWPEGNQQKALANLRRTLSSLNASLPGWIMANRDTLALKRNGKFWMDVDAFHQSLLNYHKHTHSEKETCDSCLDILEKTIEMIRGEFLEGLNLTDAPDFDEWQFFQRDGLRQKYADVLESLSTAYVERSQWEQAITCARRWVTLDRLHEPARRTLIDLYARSGQRTAALRQYDEFTRLLKEELGQEPEEKTQQLYEQVRGGEEAKRVVEIPENPNSFPLLKTKLYIPVPPASRVVRAHLLDCLVEVKRKALTIISAPAGFGKTTLLAEWIAQTSLPVAWFSLDNGDNDLYRFLSYLIAALEGIQEGVGGEAEQLMRSHQLVPTHIILASLINDIGKIPGSYVLVLDDYQFISEHAVHEAIAYLLDHLPSNMHIVIASRADPPLQLGRLRAHEEMLELRTQDLRFTIEEATEFLNEIMQLGLSTENIEVLETRTEGWVVGLKMVALSLRGHENTSEFIRAFSGSHRYILDYLVEEVLKRQPDHIQTFMFNTSILEKLNSNLCGALMSDEWKRSGESCQAVLGYLECSNLFVIPLDDHKEWYRYHQLFADLLRARLHSSLSAGEVAQLHTQASDWYSQNGLVLDAIHHAAMASNDERFEHLIEQHYIEMVNRGEMFEMRFWTGKLKKELVYRRPLLCIYGAYSHAWFGELDEADLLLEKVEDQVQLSENLDPETHAILGLLAYVKSRVAAMRGDIRKAIEICLTARENIPANDLAPQLQFDTQVTLGYEYFLMGDYSKASKVLNDTIRSGITDGAVIHTVAASCILARLYAVQGLLHKSHNTYQVAAQLVSEANEEHRDARALLEVGIADVLCEWNDLDNAMVHVKQGLDLMSWWGKVDDFALAYVTLARIHLAQANKGSTIEAVEKAIKIIQTSGVFSEARHVVEYTQVKLWLSQGDLQTANHWAESLQNRIGSNVQINFENELSCIAWARVLIAQNKHYEANGLLLSLEEFTLSSGRQGRLIEILLLKALALQAMGDTTQAKDALMKSLALAEPEGYMRIFLDEGWPLIQMLIMIRDGELNPQFENYANRLLIAQNLIQQT